MVLLATLGISFLPGCDRRQPLPVGADKQSVDKASLIKEVGAEDALVENDRVPASLDEALDLMMAEGLTDADRKFIEDAGDDQYSTFPTFGSGKGIRNSWGLWGDSPLTRYFARLGIYHAEDMSAIITRAFSRRVRGQPIDLDKLVKYYRDYWEKLDIIAPLDLKCPTCAKEMKTFRYGSGVPAHPDRLYFRGNCPYGHDFLYYHRDGWLPAENLLDEPAAPSDADKPSN